MMEQQSHHAWDSNVHYQAHTAPFFPFQGFGENGEPSVVVSFYPSFSIIHASQEWLDMFRFSREEVADRSIHVIQGPGTDFETIAELVAAGQCGKSQEATLTAYSSACQGMLLRVKSAPATNDGHVVGCVLTMHHADAVFYKQACAEDGTAKAVVSVKDRTVEWVSSFFNNMYGFQEGQLRGRTLRMIMGPSTDHRGWEKMEQSASSGQSASGVFTTCRNDCNPLDVNVYIRPVYSSQGCLTHILSTFSPIAPAQQQPPVFPKTSEHTAMVEQSFQPIRASHDAPHPSAVAGLPSEPLSRCGSSGFCHPHPLGSTEPVPTQLVFPGTTLSSTPVVSHHTSTPTVFGGNIVPPSTMLNPMLAFHPALALQSNLADFFGLSQNQGASQANSAQQEKGDTKVFPRRKQGQDPNNDSQRTAVVITLDLLESFADLSLTAAAAKLGISPTAVKKACRKLGVQRWPYRKNVEQKVEKPQYDDAYVRKLYRKYSKATSSVTRPAAKSSSAAGGSSREGVVLDHIVHEVGTGKVAALDNLKASSVAQSEAPRQQRDIELDAVIQVHHNTLKLSSGDEHAKHSHATTGSLQLAAGVGDEDSEHQWADVGMSLGLNHGWSMDH